jgi:hypothetical protein
VAYPSNLLMNKMNCELMLTYDIPALRQTGSRNLTGPKTLPTIWGTCMKIVTKYQISAINSCWEKCDEKCGYMFNVYKNQLSRQTGSRNLTGPKTLPTIPIWRLRPNIRFLSSTVTEKNAMKNILDGQTDGQTDRGKTVYPFPPSPKHTNQNSYHRCYIYPGI